MLISDGSGRRLGQSSEGNPFRLSCPLARYRSSQHRSGVPSRQGPQLDSANLSARQLSQTVLSFRPEWRNLLSRSRKKQVSRLRRIVRFATNPALLEMTTRV